MLTPAIRASRTSSPSAMCANAVSTQVCLPPFLNSCPLLDAITTGRTRPLVCTAGACAAAVPGSRVAAVSAVAPRTKSRRVKVGDMGAPGSGTTIDPMDEANRHPPAGTTAFAALTGPFRQFFPHHDVLQRHVFRKAIASIRRRRLAADQRLQVAARGRGDAVAVPADEACRHGLF